MSIIINTFNESNTKRLPWKKMADIAKRIFLDEKNIEATVNIVALDDDTIKEMNREYLQHDYATDVISFVIDDEPFMGELYISADTARKQAEEYKVSLSNEMLRLTAHGALHLCGYDDDTTEKRELMHSLEDKYLEKIGKGIGKDN